MVAALKARLSSDLRVRFLIAGGSAAAIAWLIRFPLSTLMPYWAAILAAQAIGMLYGFIVFRSWAFVGFEKRSIVAQLHDFLWVNAAGAITTAVVALSLFRWLGALAVGVTLAEPLAHAIGIGAGAVVNYLGHKQFTFRRAPSPGH